MNKILRYSLVALMAMVMGNVYADEVFSTDFSYATGAKFTGGGDGTFTGSIASEKIQASNVDDDDLKDAYAKFLEKWTNANSSLANGYWANISVRLGTSSKDGLLTSVALGDKMTDNVKVTINAAGWGSGTNTMTLAASKGTVTGEATVTLTNAEFKDFEFIISGGDATTALMITGKRMFIKSVKVETVEGGGGGGGTTPEFWDASTLDLTTAITSRENKNENLKTVPEQYPGEAPDEAQIRADATAALVLTDYIFSVETASVKLTGVSTPNSDGAPEEAWRYPTTDTKQFLNLDACPVKFAGSYLQAKTGNPSMLDIEYFFTNSDGKRVGPRTVEDFWAPGCGKLPAKGEYIEVSFSKAGTFVAGLFIQRPTSNLYIIDKETIQLLAPSAIKIAGFNNNNTVKPAEDADAYQPMKVNDDYTISYANPDYSINTGKQVFGHVSFDVEAGKTYLMLNPKNQLGIYGFQFTPSGDPSGVETIKTNKVWNADAPMYNLSGQKVDKSYKGIVIQNGRKFFNK